MYLDVSKAFIRPIVDFPFEVDVALEPQEINGDLVTFSPVHMEGSYVMMDDTIRLSGKLRTTAHAPCAVCLNPTHTDVCVKFEETFRKDADEEEDGCFRYEGKQIPLDHMTLTLVMLHMPMRFKCPTDCKSDGDLTVWNEAEKIWAEEDAELQGTYRPFEGLAQMMEKDQKQ